MKLSKALLGAILIGISVQTSSCKQEENLPQPQAENQGNNHGNNEALGNCPACGMG